MSDELPPIITREEGERIIARLAELADRGERSGLTLPEFRAKYLTREADRRKGGER